MERRYLRFVGRLWDSGEFEPGTGWETTRIARNSRPTPGYLLQLLDSSDDLLVDAGVTLRTGACGGHGGRGMASRPVSGYLPFHPAGRTVVFRKEATVLHTASLAAAPPRIAVGQVDLGGAGRIHLAWAVEHENPLWFHVVLVDGAGMATPVAQGLTEPRLVLATAGLPGGPGCALAVLATDGLRSAMARTEPFDLPRQPARLVILTPADGDTLPADQPFSLLGRAHDAAGRPLPDDQLVWLVDGQIMARGRRMVPAGPLAPGDHRVELAHASDDGEARRATARLRVNERSPAQESWRAIVSAHDAAGRDAGGLDAQRLPRGEASGA